MAVLAYTFNGQACGSPWPSATPGHSFAAAPNGLSQALTVSGSDGNSLPITRSCLKYPGELLCQPNGTLECWIYLTTYEFSIHQLNYPGECSGDVGGITVNSTGQLVGDVWYTPVSTFHFNSGAGAVPLNLWTHVALSWGSAGAKLFVNGVLVASNSNTGGFTSWSGLDSDFVFLGPGNYIDELRISNIQRTSFNPASPLPAIQEIHMYSGITVTGVVSTACSIQASPTLGPNATWTVLTNVYLPSSPYLFIDLDSANFQQRFYRVVSGL